MRETAPSGTRTTTPEGGEPAEAAAGPGTPRGRSPVLAIARVASGNFLEMYDFMVFGYFARDIGAAFFPSRDPFASLLLALVTFGAGFLMRPLGALVLGSYIDRAGRRKGLLLTLLLMSVGILILALTPPASAIGVLAPLLVLAGRLLQGFSAGAELGGVSIYLMEIAPPGRRGFYVAWQSASQQVAVLVAAAFGYAVTRCLPPAAVALYGWRIPLLFGCLIVPVLWILRRSLEETPQFTADRRPQGAGAVVAGLLTRWPAVLAGVGLVTLTTVSFYMITAYTPTFGGLLHLRPEDAFLVTALVGASNLFWLPVMGALSDRVGRRPVLLAAAALMFLSAGPVFAGLAAAPSFLHLLEAELWLSLLYGAYNGAMVVFLAESVPPEARATGFSISYALATAVFGGFTPAISTALVRLLHTTAAPALWLGSAAVLGGLGVLGLRPHGLRPPPAAPGGRRRFLARTRLSA